MTEKKINEAREHYRPAASRASLLYFILNDLNKINPLYQFSLKVRSYVAYNVTCYNSLLPPPPQAFSVVFHTAIATAEEADDVKQRVTNLIDTVTYSIFVYTNRGLFERDKLTFSSQVTFQVSNQSATPPYMFVFKRCS